MLFQLSVAAWSVSRCQKKTTLIRTTLGDLSKFLVLVLVLVLVVLQKKCCNADSTIIL